MARIEYFRGKSKCNWNKSPFPKHGLTHQAFVFLNFVGQAPYPLPPFSFFVLHKIFTSCLHVQISLPTDEVSSSGRITLSFAFQEGISFPLIWRHDLPEHWNLRHQIIVEGITNPLRRKVKQIIVSAVKIKCEDRRNFSKALLIKPYLQGAEEFPKGPMSKNQQW